MKFYAKLNGNEFSIVQVQEDLGIKIVHKEKEYYIFENNSGELILSSNSGALILRPKAGNSVELRTE